MDSRSGKSRNDLTPLARAMRRSAACVIFAALTAAGVAQAQPCSFVRPDGTIFSADCSPVSTSQSCSGTCNTAQDIDEDGDGVPNCIELEDLTDPCDTGSYAPKLAPTACTFPNGFFNQVNIATVLNHLQQPMNARVDYFDQSGVLQGTVTVGLGPKAKRDIIINDLGLKPDTYGSVCVSADTQYYGAWSGGLALYKRRNTTATAFDGNEIFDYALYYPFANPQHGTAVLPLNTFALGANQAGSVANWIRLADGRAGDGPGLVGTLQFFDAGGKLLSSILVALPDGGRFDYSGHDSLGPNAVGAVKFVPLDDQARFYIETTRYFYEAPAPGLSDRFFTAFPILPRPLTGSEIIGNAAVRSGELSILEIVNGRDSETPTSVRVYSETGAVLQETVEPLAPNASLHKILTNELSQQSADLGSAAVSGPTGSLFAVSLIYRLDANGVLRYAYAPPFGYSAGKKQLTEFNSFIAHTNRLETINATDQPVKVTVSVLDWQEQPLLSADITLKPRAMDLRLLELPLDTYGTIVMDADAPGLVVRNDVGRGGQYVMPYPAR